MVKPDGKKRIHGAIERLLTLVYPERCAFCDRTIRPRDGGICPICNGIVKETDDEVCLKCGKPMGDEGGEYCRDCEKKSHSFDRGVSLYPYSDRVAKSIYRLKYSGRRRYARFFGRKMAERFSRQIGLWQVQALIPVPLHKKRQAARGYNQAELIAQAMGEYLGMPVLTNAVLRIRNTKALKLLNASQREDNLKNAFKLSDFEVKLKTVLIVDDIYTTGSTIDEISGLLKRAGVEKVYFATAATGRM